MRHAILTGVMISGLFVVSPLVGAAEENELRILTDPMRLVAGQLSVQVDLGPSGEHAELFLDGEQACLVRAERPLCTVDLGDDPHVHLLELLRRDDKGRVVAYATRWLNRPGSEAGLRLKYLGRNSQGICGGRVTWSHPEYQDPIELEITVAGQRWETSGDGRTFGFSCPDPGRVQVMAATAIFPDGLRGVAVALAGDQGEERLTVPSPVALDVATEAFTSCASVAAEAGVEVALGDRAAFEVAFVLDPSADYNALVRSLDQGTEEGSGAMPTSVSWEETAASLSDAWRLWFVGPDDNLTRIDGFTQERASWLGLLFQLGAVKIENQPRLADAVAAAGKLAAAGHHRRAVVLILGEGDDSDGSLFDPIQVRSYLAEIGVPLFVLRTDSGGGGGGWPLGEQVDGLEGLESAMNDVREALEHQCIAWLPGELHPTRHEASLPDGVSVAGRRGEVPADHQMVWRWATATDDGTGSGAFPVETVVGERVEVTAVTVLVIAQDSENRPITDLQASDFRVAEDGRAVTVLTVKPVTQTQASAVETDTVDEDSAVQATAEETTEPMPVAVYVDRRLSGSADIASAVGALAERAEWLTSLGPVDVVIADREMEPILEAEEDPNVLREVLVQVASDPSGQHMIERIRTRYLRDMRKIPDRASTDAEPTAESGGPDNMQRVKVMNAVRSAILEEVGALRMASDRVSDWALVMPAARPRLLLVVGAGFDEDPLDFYVPLIQVQLRQSTVSARAELERFHQGRNVEALGRELAAAGWLVVPVASRTTGAMRTSAEFGGGDQFQKFMSSDFEAAFIPDNEWLMLDPIGAQRHLAAPSGGEVALSGEGLDKLATEATGWYRLTYQVGRVPDGALHDLEITTTHPDTEIRASAVVASGTSQGRAARRLRHLLRHPEEVGELQVELTAGEPRDPDSKVLAADVEVSVDFGPIEALLAQGGERVLRVSVGVRTDKSEAVISHRLETLVGAVSGWLYTMPLQWPAGPAELVVVVEDLATGAWGGAVTEL